MILTRPRWKGTALRPLPRLGALDCPGDPACYANPPCTCVGGLCVESGNSCSTVPSAGPVGSPAYIAQQLGLQQAAGNALSVPLISGISNTALLLGGAGMFLLLILARR